ncbi:MAG TPA: hypothetical protein VGY56_02010 [Verrucomicrobiae bacterium]|nr:hypothetical protein [Verrucomicrobiae bacterium]
MTPVAGLWRARDVAHGIVEGQAEDLDVEVDGVAGQVVFWPAPVGVFDDETWKGGQNKIARLPGDELEAAFLQEGNQRGDPGGADLLARPPLTFMRWGDLSIGESVLRCQISD